VTAGRRDALYAFKVLGKFVRFFRRPEHWRTLEDVKRFIGDKREGIFGCLHFLPTEDAWQKKAPAWARDVLPAAG